MEKFQGMNEALTNAIKQIADDVVEARNLLDGGTNDQKRLDEATQKLNELEARVREMVS